MRYPLLLLLPLLLLPLLLPAQLPDSSRAALLSRHNYWRAQAGAPALSWSDELATYAQAWADELARQGCAFDHRPDSPYGENIFWGGAGGDWTAEVIVDDWASERQAYRGQRITVRNYMQFGHYTQLIWAKTTQVGCAYARCAEGALIVVCNYDPAGNTLGEVAVPR